MLPVYCSLKVSTLMVKDCTQFKGNEPTMAETDKHNLGKLLAGTSSCLIRMQNLTLTFRFLEN